MERFILLLIISLSSFTGCFVSRPKYSPPTDTRTNNLKGGVAVVRSSFININNGDDPVESERNGEFAMVIISRYNRAGNITVEETYGNGGEVLSRRDVYTYDESGRNTVSSEYHNMLNGNVTWMHYEYDPKGRLAKYYQVGGDWYTEMNYGKRGYPESMVTIIADTLSDKVSFWYDRRGRLLREGLGEESGIQYHYKGKHLTEKSRKYYREYFDENGDMIKTVNVITDNSTDDTETWDGVTEAVYRHDERGNWTRRELYLDGVLFGVWLREIEYFE